MNKSTVGSVCASWWQHTFAKDDGYARMTRARLRRCTTPADALIIGAVHDLHAQLKKAGHYHSSADQLALIAITLAHIAEKGETKVATAFGRRHDGQNSPRALSELRAQVLLQITDRAELITPLHRALAIVRHTPINIAALADDLYYWSEKTRTRWCFQYFGASDSIPTQHHEEPNA